MIDDGDCYLTVVVCFDDGYMEKAASGFERIVYGVLVKRTPNHE